MLSHARVLCNSARELLEWAALEALDECYIRHLLAACSWRSLSPCDATAAVALSLYRRARLASSSIWLSLLVFSLLRFASQFRDASRLCRRSVLVFLLLRSCSTLVSSLTLSTVIIINKCKILLVQYKFTRIRYTCSKPGVLVFV